MARYYKQLECGCLVSCDGGGGLIPCCYGKINPDCKVQEYFDEHSDWCGGYCKICHPFKYKKANKEENAFNKNKENRENI